MAMQLVITLIVVFILYVVWKYWAIPVGAGYDPAPMDKVHKMLDIAGVGSSDIVYDLGCGDGRVLIAAARRFGARGVGYEIDPFRFVFAWFMTLISGQVKRVSIRFGNFFGKDIAEATVVVLFLYGPTMERLKDKFIRELKSGTRIVSYVWQFNNWALDDHLPEDRIYLYKI
ncbi:MAG: SAM-dependent methyltransferase [candidate division WOR-3 bacterium]|nr:MAG: SAM-dependent methyltransferase [candidate division WOR-3 bacterium]